jgi:mannopine transport system permease protein
MTGTSNTPHDFSTVGQLQRAISFWLLLPLILLLVVAFAAPIGRLLWGSVFSPDPTWAHYLRVFDEPIYLRIFLRTIWTAAIVTLASLVLGYPVALVMSRLGGTAALIVAACVLIPLWTSVLVRSYAWIVLLQRTGVVNTLLQTLGVTSGPLPLLYSDGAVMIAMTHVLLPYMILPIYAALKSIPVELERAALNLGASALGSFRAVTLPLSLPGVYAGMVMVFIVSLGFYVTPALVGGPRNLTIATLIGQQVTEVLNWPFAGALSGVLLVLSLALVALFRRFLQLGIGR